MSNTAQQEFTIDRKGREAGHRETETRDWKRPGALPEPDRQPGFEYRWIRQSMFHKIDPSNWASSRTEGWEPVTVTEQQHMNILRTDESKNKDTIEIGGLVLCKMPDRMHQQREDYYSNIRDRQKESIARQYMEDNDPRMKKFNESKTKVTFGAGAT